MRTRTSLHRRVLVADEESQDSVEITRKTMGVSGATSVTLRAPRPKASVETWSLPAYCCTKRSGSITMYAGEDLVVIRSRIAEALNIEDGDRVEFTFDATGEAFYLRVKVKDNICSDVLIHDFFALGMAASTSNTIHGETVVFNSSRALVLPRQNMWNPAQMIKKRGTACLYFDGASKNNPRNPSGYGFYISQGVKEDGNLLVEGYGYTRVVRNKHEMEYEGLIEGLIWATRLKLESLIICGDSRVVMDQLVGKHSITNERLKVLHIKAYLLLMRDSEMAVQHLRITPDENAIAENLANRAIATKKNVTTVNWPNVNRLR